MNKPLYTANEIKKIAMEHDYSVYKILMEEVQDDLDLYSADEMITIIEASMIVLIKTLVHSNLNLTKGSIQ